MSITKSFLILHLLFYSMLLFGQDKPEYAVSLLDTSLLANAEAVIRLEETRYIIQSPREYVHRVSKVVTIFKKDHEESEVLVFYDKYSKGALISVVLYDASGKFLRKVKKSEAMDHATHDGISILNDSRVIAVNSIGGQVPFTVEYTWEIHYRETMLYSPWQPQDPRESTETASFIIDAPEDLVLHTKPMNADFTYAVSNEEGRKIQRWNLHHHKSVVPEISGPPLYELLPIIFVSAEVFQVEGYTGSMSNWKSFGAFLYEINKGREKVTPEMSTLIQQMTKDCSSPKQMIDTLYHWLQKNMRYVSVQLGIGGWQAFDAAYVEKNGYGDCKALSTFMKGMLREVGIDSWQVVINWDEEDGFFPDDFVVNHFNHMMLHIPEEQIWLECTSNFLPTGFIDRDEENKKVLLITPTGGQIARTPTTPSALNQVFTMDTIFLTDGLMIRGKEQYRGSRQRDIRSLINYESAEKQRNYFLEQSPLSIQKLNNFRMTTAKNGEESLVEYNATLTQFGSVTGNRYFIPVNSIQPPHHSCPSNTDRKTDFISRDDYTETNDIYVQIPADYSIEFMPPKSSYTFLGNSYSVEVSVENGFLHVHHQVKETPMRLTPEQYKDLCSFYSSIAKSNSQSIVLKRSRT